jgi:hypothetical protein
VVIDDNEKVVDNQDGEVKDDEKSGEEDKKVE